MTKTAFGTSSVPLSPAVRAGDFIFVSGQVPYDASNVVVTGGVGEQTRVVLERIAAVLALAGASLDDVVKTTVFISDARDFGEFNRVYAGFFPNQPPARSTIEARLMIDAKIEIEAIAYSPA